MEKKNFKLKKFKLTKTGVQIDYKKLYVANDQPESDLITNVKSLYRHSDLDQACMALRAHFACIHGLLPDKFVTCDIQDLKEQERNTLDDVISTIEITGVVFIGKDDSDESFKITAIREVLKGKKIGMTTPIINKDDMQYNCSEHLANICDIIKEEIYEYIFNNKSTQLSLFDDVEEAQPASDSSETKAA